MDWGPREDDKGVKRSKSQMIASLIQVRSRERRILRMARGVPSWSVSRLLFHACAGSSRPSPTWLGADRLIEAILCCDGSLGCIRDEHDLRSDWGVQRHAGETTRPRAWRIEVIAPAFPIIFLSITE